MHCPVTDPLGVRQRIQRETSSVKVTPPDMYSIVTVVKTSRESYALTNWDTLTTLRAAASASSHSPRHGLSQLTNSEAVCSEAVHKVEVLVEEGVEPPRNHLDHQEAHPDAAAASRSALCSRDKIRLQAADDAF